MENNDLDYIIKNNEDRGCEEAIKYLAQLTQRSISSIKCTECPFVNCFSELASSEKVLIKHSSIIKSMYKCLDNSMDQETVLKLFSLSKSTFTYWKRNRDAIEKKIDKIEKFLYPPKEKKDAAVTPNFRPVHSNRRQQRIPISQELLPLA